LNLIYISHQKSEISTKHAEEPKGVKVEAGLMKKSYQWEQFWLMILSIPFVSIPFCPLPCPRAVIYTYIVIIQDPLLYMAVFLKTLTASLTFSGHKRSSQQLSVGVFYSKEI